MTNDLLKILTPADIEEILLAEEYLWMEMEKVTPEAILYHLLEKNQSPPSIGARFPAVLRAAETAVGRRLSNERCKDNTTIRAFVSHQLRSEEYTYSDIGRMLRRDHSTVMHLRGVMMDMLSVPQAFRREIQMYKEFKRLLGFGPTAPSASKVADDLR